MNIVAWITDHPYLTRLLVFMSAVAVAWLINYLIYTLAYYRQTIGWWSPKPTGAPPRSWLDSLPALGWWRLRRESSTHGALYWLRPCLLELAFPFAILWLYNAEVSGRLLPAARLAQGLQAELHCQFLAHYVLISFMTVATFIDYDEQLIPDTITLPGTLIGLLGSALAMLWFPLLPVTATLIEMDAASLGAWPTSLDGTQGLVLGLLIVALWCFALLDRRWITRRGWRKAPRYFIARLFRTRWWLIVGGLWLVVSAGVLLAWQVQCSRWQYLLSSLIGLAFAGGLTWGVRVAARLALQVEALGFGDVTLMAMIGTYIGWQPSLLVFFLAPLFAVCVFVLRALITGNGAGPYGPYLCMATVAVLVYWDSLRMTYAAPILTLPPMVTITILVLAVVMMGTMLWIWRLIKGPVRGLG